MSIDLISFVSFTVSNNQFGVPAYSVNNLALVTKDAPIQNYGVGASATATFAAGAITGFTSLVGGSGYSSANPPKIILLGGGGTGAVAQATVTTGAISAIAVINGGTGYTSAPTVVIVGNIGVYLDAPSVGADFGLSSETYALANNIFSQNPNILSAGGQLIIYAMNSGDTLTTAINAVRSLIFVGAYIFGGYSPNNAEIEAAAAVVQAYNPPQLLGAPSANLSDIYTGGLFPTISAASQYNTRGLLYTYQGPTATSAAQAARLAMAAYMAKLLGINFNGSNTMLTMNLKQLANVLPDPNINQTILTQCQTVGADVYAIVNNLLPESVSTGGDQYSDYVFGFAWLVGALQIAAFNFLAQTATKIPQTEQGMTGLKNALLPVLEQAVTCGLVAPGTWTGSQTFGNPTTFLANIAQSGYYVYSDPIAGQTQTARNSRVAPAVQVAAKSAGAIQMVVGVLYPQP